MQSEKHSLAEKFLRFLPPNQENHFVETGHTATTEPDSVLAKS